MFTFIIHTRFLPSNISTPEILRESERHIFDRLGSELPMVKWKNFKIIGPYEYLETFQSPDEDTALKVKALLYTESVCSELWKID